MIKSIFIVIIFIFINSNYLMGEDKVISLENNVFSFEEDCKEIYSLEQRQVIFPERYLLTINSKNNVFEYYDNIDDNSITIETDFYTINIGLFAIETRNKKTISFYLDEDQLNKIRKSHSFNLFFSKSLLIGGYSPKLSLMISEQAYINEIKKCKFKHNEYIKDKEKPINRLKKFFGF